MLHAGGSPYSRDHSRLEKRRRRHADGNSPKYLETLEAVIATALNIVKNRPLADLYVRKDYTGHFRIRSSLRAGNATSSQSKRNDGCILGRVTPTTTRAALIGVATRAQPRIE